MSGKKTNAKKSSAAPKKDTAKDKKRGKQFALPHIEFSKICVSVTLAIVIGFLIFVCYEMHRLNDLSPVGYIGGGIIICLGIVVHAYMKRAYQKDLANIEIEKTRKLTALKKKSGDDFVYERIEDVTLTV